MKVTDEQIDAAVAAAMRKAIAREPEPDDRARMAAELERWRRGEVLPPDRMAEMRLTIRDFLDAITGPAPKVRLRRRTRRGRA